MLGWHKTIADMLGIVCDHRGSYGDRVGPFWDHMCRCGIVDRVGIMWDRIGIVWGCAGSCWDRVGLYGIVWDRVGSCVGQATLNARASVLAACNPRFGRYDRSKSFAANVQIPPPLLSRFDLLFTLIDEADEARDSAIFDHLVRNPKP